MGDDVSGMSLGMWYVVQSHSTLSISSAPLITPVRDVIFFHQTRGTMFEQLVVGHSHCVSEVQLGLESWEAQMVISRPLNTVNNCRVTPNNVNNG